MDKSNNREIVPMEDEDDLEVLRLMALNTLHKKENVPIQQPKNLPPPPPLQQQQVAHKPINIMVNHTIPVLNNVRPPMDNSYYPTMDLIQSNIIHHPVPPFVNSGFEKMDINEPYVPQRIHPTSVDPFIGFPNYVPLSITTTPTAIGEPNVQLSPRTAAFVLANKETIERRRIVSPEPYRKSPGRWSRSTSRESRKYRRSVSRSPSYHNHSPNMRNRSITPTSRRRHSPAALHIRKSRSRTPISRNQHENNYNRAEKRSPNRNRGNAPPYNNRNERKFRGHEPHRGDTVRKSNSPRTDDSNYRNKQRTKSPFNSKLDVKKRSPSPFPNRKYPRNNNLNLRRGRRSPPQPGKRFNPNNNRQNDTNARNRNSNARRSASPSMNRRTDSRTPPNQQKRTTSTKNEGELTKKSAENESKSERNEDNEMNDETSTKKSETETTTNVSREKTVQEIEDELLGSDRDAKSDSDDDDGIDLFASEDSESENEGRFKLSSSKSERKTNVATVSFSELGKTAAPSADVLRDLDEVQTDVGPPGPSYRKGNPRRENGRDTRAGNSRRHGQRYNEKRSYSDRDRDRSDRGTRERENRDSNKSIGSNSSRRKDIDNDQPSVRSERKPITLKSTLNSVESEPRRKTPEAAKTSEAKERDGDEIKRGAITLKRSIKNTERDAGIRNLQSTISGPTMNEKQRLSPSIDADNGTSGKKPIHSRLGAMTSTWKSNKKSWKSEKVFFIKV